MLVRLLNWLNGWRRDFDGWLVRARRETDPSFLDAGHGFVEESSIAVRDHWIARRIDKRGRALKIIRCAATSGDDPLSPPAADSSPADDNI